MKAIRIVQVSLLVALLIPLSGCIGGDDDPTPTDNGGSDVAEGTPPEKFKFEAEKLEPEGQLVRTTHYQEPEYYDPLELVRSKGEQQKWKLEWNFTGLVPVGVGDDKLETGAAWYTVWIGFPDEGKDDGFKWERPMNSRGQVAKDTTLSGKEDFKGSNQEVTRVMLTMETKSDFRPEIVLLSVDIDPADPDDKEHGKTESWAFDESKPFAGAFADGNVQVKKDGALNLTVTAMALPETDGSYDLFIRNGKGVTFLGTLEFDASLGGHSITTSPNPNLFTRYQFFVSIEHQKDNKEEANGYPVLKSKFATVE